ncbi:MAG: GEVED domain-containing protein, partial [Candidatus Kapabacteria bacterium]|nr:GEVED domain-containing protein [Candidatus Kapabacteria bacterium]
MTGFIYNFIYLLRECPMVQRYHMTRRGRLTGLMAMFILLLSGTSATAQYCIPNAVPGWGGYGGIRRVQMNNLDVTSPFCNANCYFNTGATGDILRQVPTQIRVEAQDGNTQNFQVSVWIDVNQDGQWQNPAERFAAGTITTNFALDPNGNWTFISNPFIGTITLPCTTLLGQTRMRVRMTLGFAGDGPGPCDPYIGGVQDFNVVVGGDVVATFPDDVTDAVGLLPRGIYDGQNNTQRPSVTMRVGAPNQSFNVTYRIQGPLPGTNIVYQGHQVGNPNATTFSVSGPTSGTFPQLFTFNVPAARFSLAGTNGALDARFAIGGEYQVIVTASSTAGCFSEWAKTFTIAVDRDISTRLIRSPRTNEPPSRFKYPNTVGIPVEAVFQNAGLFNVEEFRAIATITDPNGVVAYRDTVNVVQELTPRQRA